MAIADLFRRAPAPAAKPGVMPYQPWQAVQQNAATFGISEFSIQGISAYRRGERLISRTIGMLPVTVTYDGIVTDELPPIVRRPVPWETRQTTFTAAVASLLRHGNWVAIIGDIGADGWPANLVPVPVQRVSVKLVAGVGIVYSIGSQLYRSTDVVHLKQGGAPGDLVGRGVLADGLAAFGLASSVDEATSKYYAQGVYPSGILKPGYDMSPEDADLTRAAWVAKVRRNEPVVLPPDVEFIPLGSPSAEAQQLAAATKLSRSQVADLLDLDPDWLDASVNSRTYANIVDRLANLIRLTLQPMMVTLEDGFSDLLPRDERMQIMVDDLQRGQMTDRFAAYATALTSGWLTADEVREDEGRPPLGVDDELPAVIAADQDDNATTNGVI